MASDPVFLSAPDTDRVLPIFLDRAGEAVYRTARLPDGTPGPLVYADGLRYRRGETRVPDALLPPKYARRLR